MKSINWFRPFRRSLGIACLAVTGIGLIAAQPAAAVPLNPDIDFRSEATFDSDPKGRTSVGFSFVDPGGATVTGTVTGETGDSAADLWWDSSDGLGIQAMEQDEIDVGETLSIEFDQTVGISHVYFADFFADESFGGTVYDEKARIELSPGSLYDVRADTITPWGDGSKGEGAYGFGNTMWVDSISLTARSQAGQSDFAVLGLYDPVSVPEPGTLALFAFGLAGAGLIRRRVA